MSDQNQLDAMRKLAIKSLRRLQAHEDRAHAHVEADRVLTTLLVSLGYEDVVVAYEKIHKWYE